MKSTNITFIFPNSEPLTFEEQVIELLDNSSLFNEIALGKNTKEHFISLEKDTNISIDDLLRLRIRVKEIGFFYVFLKTNTQSALKLTENITALLNIEVNNKSQASYKVKQLFGLFKDEVLFSLYSPKGEFSLTKEELDLDTFILIMNSNLEEEQIVTTAKAQNQSENRDISGLFSSIKANGGHFAFVLISTFLIGFATSIGIFYRYKADSLYLFFFACALVGAIINAFVYIDFFKKYKLLSLETLLTAIDVFVAAGFSAIGFYIFYDYQKEIPESLNGMTPVLLITIAVLLISNIVLCLLGYFIGKRLSGKNIED